MFKRLQNYTLTAITEDDNIADEISEHASDQSETTDNVSEEDDYESSANNDNNEEAMSTSHASPEVVEVEQPKFRGKFHCRLCPNRILLSEDDLTKHLESKIHHKRELQWEKEETEKRLIRKQFNCKRFQHENIETPEEANKHHENDDDASEKSDQMEEKKKKKKKRKQISTTKAKNPLSLTPEQISKQKTKFQEKKARREERRLQQQQA